MKAYYLDIGNTSLRLAVPSGNGWEVLWHQLHEERLDRFLDLLKEMAEKDSYMVYVSSVRKDIFRKLQVAAPEIHLQILSATHIPEQFLNYSTVHTLGMDRFLGCLGAHHLTGKAVVVIDTGSACTVDFMDDEGVYQGGVIMPGIDILKKSMKRYLPELPDVQASIPDVWPGKTTQESLRWGVNGMFKAAIAYWIQKYQLTNNKSEVFITGGNSKDVQKLLMSDTEIVHQPELQFFGMKIYVEQILSSKEGEF